MSASLVGSEMCIRDRPSSQADRQPSSQATNQAAKQPNSQSVSQSVSHAAVSYTHLTLPTICSV
eukprot:1319775-Alexandrium_andersonii.AAC.1